MPLPELAREVAARDTGKDISDLSSKEIDTAYVSLYQTHIPVLSAHGIVNREENTNTIRRENSVSALAAIIRQIDSQTKIDGD